MDNDLTPEQYRAWHTYMDKLLAIEYTRFGLVIPTENNLVDFADYRKNFYLKRFP